MWRPEDLRWCKWVNLWWWGCFERCNLLNSQWPFDNKLMMSIHFPYHPWDDCIFTCMNGWSFMVNVAKYTIHGSYGFEEQHLGNFGNYHSSTLHRKQRLLAQISSTGGHGKKTNITTWCVNSNRHKIECPTLPMSCYPPANKHSNGKSPSWIGNTSSNGGLSIAMLDYRTRSVYIIKKYCWNPTISSTSNLPLDSNSSSLLGFPPASGGWISGPCTWQLPRLMGYLEPKNIDVI